MFLFLCVLFSFLAASLTLVGISLSLESHRQIGRLNSLLPLDPDPAAKSAVGQDGPGAQPMLSAWLRPLTAPLENRITRQRRKQLRLKLLRAGMLDHISESEMVALGILTAAAGFVGAMLLYFRLAPKNPGNAAMLSLLVVFISFMLPEYWLQSRANERQARIRKSLPDAIDLLAVSVEAGSGFDGAMSQIEAKFPGPFADEIHRLLEEMRLGRSRTEALRAMAERAGVPDLTTFVSAICQADQMGVSITGILRVQADTIRERRVQQIKEAAQKLPVKMLFPLVFFIFPSVFVVILGSAMIRILQAFSGISAGR